MRKILISMIAVAAFGAATVAPAAASTGPSESRPVNTTGYCVSDIFYGNEPNFDAEGNVIPSQSPGPKKTLPNGDVVPGSSIGDYQQLGVNIPQLCHAATQ
jgi:hypothetical protein